MSKPLITIPSYITKEEHCDVLKRCVKSLVDSAEAEIYIVDDCSPYDSKKLHHLYTYLEETYGAGSVRKPENSGFAATVNYGLNRGLAEERDVVLVNADMEFKDYNWLRHAQETEADIVGGLLLYPNFLIQHAGIYFSAITRNFDHRFVGAAPNLPAAQDLCECPVTGALQYIRYETLKDVGLYDEGFFLGHEDVDYCLRAILADKKILYNPKVKAIHYESLFRSESHEEEQRESYLRLVEKYEDTNFFNLVPTMLKGPYEYTKVPNE